MKQGAKETSYKPSIMCILSSSVVRSSANITSSVGVSFTVSHDVAKFKLFGVGRCVWEREIEGSLVTFNDGNNFKLLRNSKELLKAKLNSKSINFNE
jgi:hypothetical protein